MSPPTEPVALGEHLRGRPVSAILPSLVLSFGLLTTLLVGMFGYLHFRTISEEIAAQRARILAETTSERLRVTAEDDHETLLRRISHRTGSEMLIANDQGEILADATAGTGMKSRLLSLLVKGRGETTTRLGRSQFFVEPIGGAYPTYSLVTFIRAPQNPRGATALLKAVGLWALILMSIAAGMAYLLGRDLERDVTHMQEELSRLTQPAQSTFSKPLPIQGADQLARLRQAYNLMLDRFAAAARAYEVDLEHVAAQDLNRTLFLAALSHELRTPLNAILGFSDLLLDEIDGPIDEETRENLMVIRASGSHLRGLIDDILELSALESGQLRLSPSLVDITDLVEDVAREASVRVRDNPVKLTTTGERHIRAMVDERRIWQVISNLVNNAIKFTPSGTITIRVGLRQQNVIIAVEDTGLGIPPSEMKNIFAEFQQAGNLRQRREGTGLGLFIAKRLVLMHGGTITARSELGNGSTFVVSLPLDGPQAPPQSDFSSSPRTSTGREP